MITEAELERIERLVEAATPGPWKASQTEPPGEYCIHSASSPWQVAGIYPSRDGFPVGANAAFIASSRTDVPALLSTVRELMAHARLMSDALIKVRPLGGSELFVRIGDEFYADPKYCGEAITQTKAELHEARKAKVITERRAEAAEAEVERLRGALADGAVSLDPEGKTLWRDHYATVINDAIAARAALGGQND